MRTDKHLPSVAALPLFAALAIEALASAAIRSATKAARHYEQARQGQAPWVR